MFPDFTPIELRGMSIITATFFFFAGVGAHIFTQFVKTELKRLDKKVDDNVEKLDKKVDDNLEKIECVKDNISELKTSMAVLVTSTQHIEKIFESHSSSIENFMGSLVMEHNTNISNNRNNH